MPLIEGFSLKTARRNYQKMKDGAIRYTTAMQGKPAYTRRKVYVFDLNLNEVENFPCLKAAQKKYGVITNAIKTCRPFKGHYFSYQSIMVPAYV